MSINTRRALAAATALLGVGALALTACSAPTEPAASPSSGATAEGSGVDPYAPEQSEVTALVWRQTSTVPFFIAQSEAIADEYGLTLTPEYVENSPAAVSGIVGGSGNFGQASLWAVFSAINEGIDLRIVGEGFRHVPDSMFMETLPGSGIESIEDLAGKKVGVTGLNAGHDLSIKNWFTENGLDPNSIEFVSLGYGEMGQALQTGAIDAGAFTGAALAQARSELGSVDVFDFTEILDNFPAVSYIVDGAWADANPNTVAAFQCSVVVRGAELAAEDDDLYREALKAGLGWDDAAVDATTKVDYVPLNDPEAQRVVPDLMFANGLLPEEIDIEDYLIPIPDNC